MTTLKQLPALVVLERIPVPVLAIADDGSILFTNTAFAQMVGCDPDEVLALRFHEIFHQAPQSESSLSLFRACPGEHGRRVGAQGRLGGPGVDEQVGGDARRRQIRSRGFQDLTEQLWEEER